MELTQGAKSAIRQYMFKMVLPSGVALGIVASLITFFVQDIAREQAKNEVYKEANAQILRYLEKTIEAKEQANTASQRIKVAFDEISKLNSKAKAAEREIDSYLEKSKNSASLASSESTLDKIAEKLGTSQDFLNKVSISKELPVGTVISSMVQPHVFLSTNTGKYWLPSDGRAVPKTSLYYKLTGQANLPDLRGMFLRGVNQFEKGTHRTDGREDPINDREAGSYQADEFKSHQHVANMEIGAEPISGRAQAREAAGAHGRIGTMYTSNGLINLSGGEETRPKNIAVYYYMKIN